ncbi:MAG TPA: DUF3631 domain-containing protein [Myxococcales bacterium]|nr:DUF3631 domain-containing protein [Myxococcales bacterium]
MFSEDDPYAGIDLDHVRDPDTGQFEPWAREIITRLDSYSELSQSGTGAHIIVRAKVPGTRRRKGDIEIYDAGRYFCMTGERLEGMPGTVEERQVILNAIHAELFDASDAENPAPSTTLLSDEDKDLIDKACSAQNGTLFSTLWEGGWKKAKYESQSEADAALLGLLRFWTGGNKEHSFELFSKSGLTREKWESREDYRERTWDQVNHGVVFPHSQDPVELVFEQLADLPPVEYDQQRKSEAKRLNIRVSTLDQEVGRKRKLAMDASTVPGELDFSDPAPWPEAISDAEKLFDQISARISRYVVLPKAAADAIALWVGHAHALDSFNITPRLNLSSPDKGCGKTTLLDVIATLLPRHLRSENCTPAILFRLIDKFCPTLLLDEVDALFLGGNEEIRAILNSGHRRGGKIHRCEGDLNQVRAFDVFAPVVLAGIGSLPGTLFDRSLLIPLVRAKPGEIAHRFDSRKIAKETELKTKLSRWSIDYLEELTGADPVLPESAHNRLADNWRPLFAIAQAVGGSWPDKVCRAFEHLNSNAQAEEAQGIGTTLLADIRDFFDETGSRKLFSATIVERLVEIEGRPWAEYRRGKPISKNQLARLLRRFKIKSKSIRIGTDTGKGYHLDDFAEAFERFLPPSQESSLKRDNVTNPENKGDSDTSETSHGSADAQPSRLETSQEEPASRLVTSHPKPVTLYENNDLFNFPKEKPTSDVVTLGNSNPAQETTDTYV